MKKSSKAFYVLYVNDSSPKLKKFKSRESADKFIAKFKANPKHKLADGYWVDLYFEGVIFEKDEHF